MLNCSRNTKAKLLIKKEKKCELGKKSFCKTWFQVRDGAEKKYTNKAEMKERKKTTLHLQKYTPDVG